MALKLIDSRYLALWIVQRPGEDAVKIKVAALDRPCKSGVKLSSVNQKLPSPLVLLLSVYVGRSGLPLALPTQQRAMRTKT